jgi:hypothetical protein
MDAEADRTIPRRFRFNLLFLFALTTFAAIGSCVCVTVARKIELKSVTPAEANEAFAATVSVVRVPDSARNVDVFARFQRGHAAFDIAELDFLEFARNRSWKIETLSLKPNVPTSYQLEGHLPGWPEDAQHVLYFTNSSHRGGWTVMYDRGRHRAYVFFAPR